MLVCLLKVQGWPLADHWHQAIVSLQSDADQRFTLSMRQTIDPAPL